MIRKHCFTEEWLDRVIDQAAGNRIDKIILEKMIHALHLVERLKVNGLQFVFKGGTSLVLLLSKGGRFSIDIDIICTADRKELEGILDKVIESSEFTEWKLDEYRSYQDGVPKAHYKLSFDSNKSGSGTILLDVLVEDSIYPELIKLPVKTRWIETEEETLVTVPSIDSITGDKLTAFASETTGIPYFKGKDRRPSSKEICKQLFDLSRLFDQIEDLNIVAESFHGFAKQEIDYRKLDKEKSTLTPEDVLRDTMDTCKIISLRGVGSEEEKNKFHELQRGITSFRAFVMEGRFHIDQAIPAAARVAYLATKILIKDYSPIIQYDGQRIKELNIEDPDWNALN